MGEWVLIRLKRGALYPRSLKLRFLMSAGMFAFFAQVILYFKSLPLFFYM